MAPDTDTPPDGMRLGVTVICWSLTHHGGLFPCKQEATRGCKVGKVGLDLSGKMIDLSLSGFVKRRDRDKTLLSAVEPARPYQTWALSPTSKSGIRCHPSCHSCLESLAVPLAFPSVTFGVRWVSLKVHLITTDVFRALGLCIAIKRKQDQAIGVDMGESRDQNKTMHQRSVGEALHEWER